MCESPSGEFRTTMFGAVRIDHPAGAVNVVPAGGPPGGGRGGAGVRVGGAGGLAREGAGLSVAGAADWARAGMGGTNARADRAVASTRSARRRVMAVILSKVAGLWLMWGVR